MIEVTEVVKIHFVLPDTAAELCDAHTHGLEAFGHPEFQVLVPGFCRGVAGSILINHADRVINRGERFQPGDTGEIGGAIVGYIEVREDFEGGPTRLRIVDVPPEFGLEAEGGRRMKFSSPEEN
jgi:hypothetical protein